MVNKEAYSLFRPVDVHTDSYLGDETTEAASPFPEDLHGDPVTQLRAYRENSHPLTALARARTQGDMAALAEHFMQVNLRGLQPSARDVQNANFARYRALFKR